MMRVLFAVIRQRHLCNIVDFQNHRSTGSYQASVEDLRFSQVVICRIVRQNGPKQVATDCTSFIHKLF